MSKISLAAFAVLFAAACSAPQAGSEGNAAQAVSTNPNQALTFGNADIGAAPIELDWMCTSSSSCTYSFDLQLDDDSAAALAAWYAANAAEVPSNMVGLVSVRAGDGQTLVTAGFTNDTTVLITGGTNGDPSAVLFGSVPAGSSNSFFLGFTPAICGLISHGDCTEPGPELQDPSFPSVTVVSSLSWQ
jgi:hypothetical protein